MITTAIDQHPADSHPRAKEFFLARQPILNNKENLVAYELLFRHAQTDKTANVVDDLSATASVIAHASELGIVNVIGGLPGFVNVDAEVLMRDIIGFLPSDKVVLEILETVEVTPELLARVAELTELGYTFALDDVICCERAQELLMPLVKIIKIDITGMDEQELTRLACRFKEEYKLLLAEKVETLEQFRLCQSLGFHYFQGYYFARPVILSGKKLSPSQLTIMQLMTLIAADAETNEIESGIKKDASLAMTLLRLANSPGAGVLQRIDSLSQALTVLGRRQLQRWLQIMLYADSERGHFTSPLLQLASTRGKLLELITERLHPEERAMADTAFTVGIMSLMDTLFGQPMAEILEQVSVVDEVSHALLYRKGFYGDLLKLAEYMERIEQTGALLIPTLRKLDLSIEDLYALQLQAFEWSNNLSAA